VTIRKFQTVPVKLSGVDFQGHAIQLRRCGRNKNNHAEIVFKHKLLTVCAIPWAADHQQTTIIFGSAHSSTEEQRKEYYFIQPEA